MSHPVMEIGDDSVSFTSEDENALADFFVESSGDEKPKEQAPPPPPPESPSQLEASTSAVSGSSTGGRLLMKRTINKAADSGVDNSLGSANPRATIMFGNGSPVLPRTMPITDNKPVDLPFPTAQPEMIKTAPEVGKRPVVRQLGRRISAPKPPIPIQREELEPFVLRQEHGKDVLGQSGGTTSPKSPSVSMPGSNHLLENQQTQSPVTKQSEPFVLGQESEPFIPSQHKDPEPFIPSQHKDPEPFVPTQHKDPEPFIPTQHKDPEPFIPSQHKDPEPFIPSQHKDPEPFIPSQHKDPEPFIPSQHKDPEPFIPSQHKDPEPFVPTQHKDPEPFIPSQHKDPEPFIPSQHKDPEPFIPSQHKDPEPFIPSQRKDPEPFIPSQHKDPEPFIPSQHKDPEPFIPSQHKHPEPFVPTQHKDPEPFIPSQHKDPEPLSPATPHLQPKATEQPSHRKEVSPKPNQTQPLDAKDSNPPNSQIPVPFIPQSLDKSRKSTKPDSSETNTSHLDSSVIPESNPFEITSATASPKIHSDAFVISDTEPPSPQRPPTSGSGTPSKGSRSPKRPSKQSVQEKCIYETPKSARTQTTLETKDLGSESWDVSAPAQMSPLLRIEYDFGDGLDCGLSDARRSFSYELSHLLRSPLQGHIPFDFEAYGADFANEIEKAITEPVVLADLEKLHVSDRIAECINEYTGPPSQALATLHAKNSAEEEQYLLGLQKVKDGLDDLKRVLKTGYEHELSMMKMEHESLTGSREMEQVQTAKLEQKMRRSRLKKEELEMQSKHQTAEYDYIHRMCQQQIQKRRDYETESAIASVNASIALRDRLLRELNLLNVEVGSDLYQELAQDVQAGAKLLNDEVARMRDELLHLEMVNRRTIGRLRSSLPARKRSVLMEAQMKVNSIIKRRQESPLDDTCL